MSDKDVLFKFLEAIDYSGDRDAFVNEFIGLAWTQTVADFTSSLPQDQQDKVKQELSASTDPQHAVEIIKNHFTQEQIDAASQNATKQAIKLWLEAIENTLSDGQKDKLVALSQELSPTPAQ